MTLPAPTEGIPPHEFRQTLGRFASGVTVITAAAGQEPARTPASVSRVKSSARGSGPSVAIRGTSVTSRTR